MSSSCDSGRTGKMSRREDGGGQAGGHGVPVDRRGVFEDPGGAEGYEHGGWTFEYDRGDEGNKFKLDEGMEAEAHLLGRVTYDGFAEAWPSREGEFADKLNSDRKYVVSTTLENPTWNNTTVIAETVGSDGVHVLTYRRA